MFKRQLHYLTYYGSANINLAENVIEGHILGIPEKVTYRGVTPLGLQDAFVEAVDAYLARQKKAIAKEVRKKKGAKSNPKAVALQLAPVLRSITDPIDFTHSPRRRAFAVHGVRMRNLVKKKDKLSPSDMLKKGMTIGTFVKSFKDARNRDEL